MARIIIGLIAALAATQALTQALAQEPVGCDKFKWPLDSERALLIVQFLQSSLQDLLRGQID